MTALISIIIVVLIGVLIEDRFRFGPAMVTVRRK
jgi:hypothetical protein